MVILLGIITFVCMLMFAAHLERKSLEQYHIRNAKEQWLQTLVIALREPNKR